MANIIVINKGVNMSKDLKGASISDLITELQEIAEHFEQVSLPAVKNDEHSTEIYETWVSAIGEACFRLRKVGQQ